MNCSRSRSRAAVQPSSSAYLAVYGWVRGTVARGLLHCICQLMALSGHASRVAQCPLSGVKRTKSKQDTSSTYDPYVWSGRALQEDFVEWADVRSCINVSGL